MEYNFAYIVQLLSNAFTACQQWVWHIMDKTGTVPFYMGALAVFLAVRFFIAPIVGSYIGAGSSDVVKDIRGTNYTNGSSVNISNKKGGKRK